MTSLGTYQRARSPERKQQRSQELLEAARVLAQEFGVRAVTLTAIAERVGLHHSAMRRYFTSHKEVLLQLAAEGWTRWAEELDVRLGSETTTAPSIVDALVGTLRDEPLFCDLLANVPLRLEHDVDIEAIREYKQISVAAFDRMTSRIARAIPTLGHQGAEDFMSATYSLAATLWQVSNPGDKLSRIYEEEPGLAHLRVDFSPKLHRLASAVLAGLLTSTNT